MYGSSNNGATLMKQDLQATLLEITRRHFTNIETLATRRSGSLDFHDVAVWEVRSALEAACRAGQASVANKIDGCT